MDSLKISPSRFFSVFVSLTTHLNKEWSPRQQVWKYCKYPRVCVRWEKRGEVVVVFFYSCYAAVCADWSIYWAVHTLHTLAVYGRCVMYGDAIQYDYLFSQGAACSKLLTAIPSKERNAAELASWIHRQNNTLCVKQIVFFVGYALEYVSFTENAHPYLRSTQQGQQFIPASVIDPSSLLQMTASADRFSLFCWKFLHLLLLTLLYQ